MTNKLRIEFDWLEFERGSEMDRAFAASIGIAVGDAYLTRIDDLVSKTVRNQIRGCAWHLGAWFAANWWRLRWEPVPQYSGSNIDWLMAHDMASVGGGFVWPNVVFACDGESMEISLQACAAGVAFEPIRYINSLHECITAIEFEQQVDLFMEGVVGRLDTLGVTDRRLAELWSEIQRERSCEETSERRKLEALAGYDPDEAPEEMMALLLEDQDHLGMSALEELAAAARHDTANAVQRIRKLSRTNGKPEPGGFRAIMPDLQADAIVHVPGQEPWKLATRLAAQARRQWSLGDGPITNESLMALLRANQSAITNDDVMPTVSPLAIQVDRQNTQNTYDIYFNRRPRTTRRFAVARLIGDYLYYSNTERLRPATDSKTARQKFQRAFSQSFLCPIESLMNRLGTDQPNEDDISEAAEYFDVSPRMVRTTLVNKGVLSRNALAWDD